MFRPLAYAVFLALALAGCAHAPPPIADADCRHVLTPDGRPVRFCESGTRVIVDQHPPGATNPALARMIDNPEFLAQMIDRLPPVERPVMSKGRLRREDRICSAATPGYITIRTSDFLAMVGAKVIAVNPGVRISAVEPEPKLASAAPD